MIKVQTKRWSEKKKFNIQQWNSDWRTACCDQSRIQMTLKMLGVCSSLQYQQFWFLNHSISSSYERVMIKIRNQKSRTKLQIFRFDVVQVMEMEGREVIWMKRKRGIFVQKLEELQPSHVWSACATRGQRAGWAVWHTWSTRGGLWPACSSRAPRTFFDRIRSSELRIRIRFQITNRDSLTHNDDYETLTNGWEFISEIDDEHNSTNENAK